MIRHIPGKQQVIADFFSRVHMLGIDRLVQVNAYVVHGRELNQSIDIDYVHLGEKICNDLLLTRDGVSDHKIEHLKL